MAAFALREYQEEALKAIDLELAQVDRTIVVAAVGAGKTIMFLAWLDRKLRERPRARGLILAHRMELIRQPIERAEQFLPDLAKRMGVVMAEEDDCDAQVVVATVQSLNSAGRLDRVLQSGPFAWCIVDEVHHSVTKTYTTILDRLAQDGTKVIGYTATPIRTDGDGLRRVFESCAFRFSITAGIEHGALVPFNALGFSLPVRFDGLRATEDGWDNEPLGDLLKAENVLEIVYEKWQETGGAEQQTLCFTASVAQAHATAEYFRSRGVAAQAIDGTTPKDEREDARQSFLRGDLRMIANCMVFNEGADFPNCSCLLMVAPTKSDLLYVQRLGRALRTYPDKKAALVLDFAPLNERDVICAGDVLGKPRDLVKAERRAEEAGILLGGVHLDQFGAISSIDPVEITCRWLDYLSRKSKLAWSLDGAIATATLSSEALLAIALPPVDRIAKGEKLKREGQWRDKDERLLQALRSTRLVLIEKVGGRWQSKTLGHFVSEDDAKAEADRVAERLADPLLAKRAQAWRRKPASAAQLQLLRRWDVLSADTLDRGRASQMISDTIAKGQALQHLRAEETRI